MDKFEICKLEKEFAGDVFNLEKQLIGSASFDGIVDSVSSDVLDYYVLKLDEKIIGFYEAKIIAPEAELYDVAVAKEYQGKGYGSALLNHFFDVCKSRGVVTIFLEVNSINNNAIKLYEKFGFEAYAKRKKYYGNNDAILMKKQF